MILIDQLKSIFPDANDYLVSDDGVTCFAVWAEPQTDAISRVFDFNGKMCTIKNITVAEATACLPYTSLVTGTRYEAGTSASPIPFMTELQVKALQIWLNYQQKAFNKAKEAFLSLDVMMAQNIFSNPNNGLQAFVYAMGEAVQAGTLSPTTVIPGITPSLTVQDFSLLLDFWVIVKAAISTPTEHSGITVQDYITRI